MRGAKIGNKRRVGLHDTSGWLVTLSDCLLLLLTFFVMLFAMSSVQSERWRDLSQSLARVLRPIAALDPRALPRPAAEPVAVSGKRDVDYVAGLLARTVAQESALAGYALTRTPDGLAIRPPSVLWQEGGSAVLMPPAIGPMGRAGLALLADRLRLVDNALVVRVRAPLATDTRALERWTETMARGMALSDALRQAGIGRETPVLATPAAPGGEAEVDLLLRPAREGGR